jgi:hypothetical protein
MQIRCVVGLAVVVTFGVSSGALARRARCEDRCGYRITRCVLERGGVDGALVRECTRRAVRECRARGPRACPLPTHADLVAMLASVQTVEATVHIPPLCATTLPDAPAATIDEAIAVGRESARGLAATDDPTFEVRGGGYRGGAFGKLFIQGFFGHGAAFVPLGNVVVATTRPRRAVTYATDSFGAIVHGVVGVADGRARGILLTYCPAS